MFDEAGMSLLRQSSYDILQLNHHDATIHSRATGHEWIIVSNYQSPNVNVKSLAFLKTSFSVIL